MAGNSWQSPTTGEPSWGTMHTLATEVTFLTSTQAITATTMQFTASSSQIPVGIRALHFILDNASTTLGDAVSIRDLSRSNAWVRSRIANTGVRAAANGPVPVSSSGGFKLVAASTNDMADVIAVAWSM